LGDSSEDKKQLRGGRYILVRTLGEGSQGETYEAIDNGGNGGALPERSTELVNRWERYVEVAKANPSVTPKIGAGLVAIKCFRMGKAKAWKDVELAEREATTLRQLDHPRLPKYIEHFEEDGALYLVMEKIEGESLAELRKKKRVFGADEVVRMLEETAEALRYLHGRAPPIVHRDIKPGNVIRRPDGRFAIVDFGSVRDRLKPAGGSTVVGTFGYMAPEQFQGRASAKSDVYGVGATALAMLTGEEPEDLPHEGLGIDVARAVADLPGTPKPLVRALQAMLTPDPDRRAASIDEALARMRGRPARDATTDEIEERVRKHVDRQLRRRERHERRRQRRRENRRRGAVPFLPRMLAMLGLLVATLVVWAVVGIATPIVLTVLSFVFGSALRRAAAACVHAAHRSQQAMVRASARLGGAEPADEGAEAQVRIAAEPDKMRVAGDGEAAKSPDEPSVEEDDLEDAGAERGRKGRARA
jgi:serine/threonine protein kinase